MIAAMVSIALTCISSPIPKSQPRLSQSRKFFEPMRLHDLEGVVAKRLADPYAPRVRWLKIKNPDYTQKEGRGDLFNRRR